MTQMSMGSNLELTASSVRAALRWTGGAGIPDVDASAILLEEGGEVASDADFVFYNQPQHFSGSVRMAGKSAPPQASDQVDVDLTRVPGNVARIVLAASVDSGTFGMVPDLRLVLTDLSSGQDLAAFPMQAGVETAFLSAEIYRRNGAWRFRAVGQGYSAGLAGLAADFGIDTGHSDAGGASGAEPAAASAPPPLPDLPTPPTFQPPPAPPAFEPTAPPPALPTLGAPPAAPSFEAPPTPPAFEPATPPPALPTLDVPPAAPSFEPPPVPTLDLSAPPPFQPPPAPSLDRSAQQAPDRSSPPSPATAGPAAAPLDLSPPDNQAGNQYAAPDQPAPPVGYPPPVQPPVAAQQPPMTTAPPVQPSAPQAAPLLPPAAEQAAAQPPTGVSLRKNEAAPLVRSGTKPLTRVVFSLGWAPAEGRSDIDLDASVIAFDQAGNKLAIVWYMHLSEFMGALQHTGDNRKGGYGDVEQILVDLVRMPPNVHSLVFTINSFRGHTFTDVRYAFCAVQDVDDGEMLARFDLSETQPSTALLIAELRRDGQGSWRIRAIGEFHDYRTVRKLVPAAARQVKLAH